MYFVSNNINKKIATKSNPPRQQSGFSLVELLVVIAIIGILVGVGYPSYQAHVFKSNRTDAMGDLVKMAQSMERCAISNSSIYTSCKPANRDSSEGYYTLSATVTATTFTLTATAKGNQTSDKDCASLSLNQSGARSAKNSSGTDNSAACWNQ